MAQGGASSVAMGTVDGSEAPLEHPRPKLAAHAAVERSARAREKEAGRFIGRSVAARRALARHPNVDWESNRLRSGARETPLTPESPLAVAPAGVRIDESAYSSLVSIRTVPSLQTLASLEPPAAGRCGSAAFTGAPLVATGPSDGLRTSHGR